MAPRIVRGDADIRAVQDLASRLWPVGWHPGGLGWALARGQLADEVVLFEGADGVSAWAARSVHEPGELLAQVDPARADVADEVVAWLLASAGSLRATVEVHEGDATLASALRRGGFVPDAGAPVVGMFRPAGRADRGGDGWTVRAVRDDELPARVAVHRAAWKPATLPWVDGRVTAPEAESSFTAAAYEAVRRTWLYRQDLDLVAVAPDGELAGCCIAWLDPASGVAELEPLGVAPGHRRRGVAVALCLEVAARVAAAGGHEVFINTGPQEEYPAPAAAYAKAGFGVEQRATTYVRAGTQANGGPGMTWTGAATVTSGVG
jgi:ribosomal protein S18 acetylase RimI-like enzyme